MSALHDEGQGQVQYAYFGGLGMGIPEQLLAQSMLAQHGTQIPSVGQFKNCNCKKAKCLKLYCVCFQAGVYCNGCSCSDCLNLQDNDKMIARERQRILQREGPQAFGRKNAIQAAGLHLKGCRCSRSKCAKKYCECFDYQVPCSELCKCKDCRNPNNKDIGMPRFAVTAAQQQQLLMAMQQKQLGGNEAMELDAAGLLQMQALQQQQQQQQGLLQLEDLSGIAGLPLPLQPHLPSSQPTSQPYSRPESPATAHQAFMHPAGLQQLAALPPAVRMPSAAGQGNSLTSANSGSFSGKNLLQKMLQQQQLGPMDAMLTTEAPVAHSLPQMADAAAGAYGQDVMHTAGVQLLQQYGQWGQVPASAGLPSFAAAASSVHTLSMTPQQQAAAAAAAATSFVAGLRAAQARSNDRGSRSASEQPLTAEEAPLDTSQQGTGSQRNSREPSEGPVSMEAAPGAADVTAVPLDTGGSEGNPAVASAAPLPEEAVQRQHQSYIKIEGGVGSTEVAAESADASQAARQIAMPTGSMWGIAPGRGVQSGLFAPQGAVITTATQHQQKEPGIKQTDSIPAVAPMIQEQQLQQGAEQQNTNVTVETSARMDSATSYKQAATPAVEQLEGHSAAAASAAAAAAAARASVQQQLLAAVGNYMCQAPHAGGAAVAAPAGNELMSDGKERQHHQSVSATAAPSAPVTLADLSRLQSGGLLSVAADGAGSQGLEQLPAAEPKDEAANDGLRAGEVDAAALLSDPVSAADLAQRVGLDEAAAEAAKLAAMYLQSIMQLHIEGPDSASLRSSIAQQQQHLSRRLQAGQQQLFMLGYKQQQSTPLLAPAAGPQLAVLTDRPLAAVQAAAGISRLSPAVHALQRQHLAAANSPLSVSAALPATAATPASAGLYVGVQSRGLAHTVGGVTSTPSPVTAHAYRHCGSVRGPSPLGPVSNIRGRESGLLALLGPGKQHLQQQHGTPVAAPPPPPAAPGSGTSSAAEGSARRSMQLLPGSFRISGNVHSPAVSHDSAAHPAVTAANAAVLGHLAGLRGDCEHVNSPAGSISFAPSNASLGQVGQHATAAAACVEGDSGGGDGGGDGEERTPVFTNSQKISTEQKEEQRVQQPQPAQAVQEQSQPADQAGGDAAGVSPVPGAFPAPAPAAGAHTPLTECEVAAQMAAAAARMVSAPTPAMWQSQAAQGSLTDRGPSAEVDPVAAILGSFGGHAWPSMTPAGMDIAFGSVRSVLAGLTSPFDPASFLSSPLPHMTSVLRGAATGGAGGLRTLGLRLNEMTPVLLNLQQQAAAGSTGCSTGAQRRGATVKTTHGVKALCAGWGEGNAGTAGNSTAAAAAGAAADGSSKPAVAVTAGGLVSRAQIDAPASGRKVDTDKAAARAAAAAVECGQDVVYHAAGSCGAGMNSLIAAAEFISTPGYDDDEVPSKRRRQDNGTEPGQQQSCTTLQQQQLHREQPQQQLYQEQQQQQLCSQLDVSSTSASWAAFQELDTKHALESTSEIVPALIPGAAGMQQDAGKPFSFTAQPRRVLLPAAGSAHSNQQQQNTMIVSQTEPEHHQPGGEWGSQVGAARSASEGPATSSGPASGQLQQQQLLHPADPQGCHPDMSDMQLKQEQLAALHMQQWAPRQQTTATGQVLSRPPISSQPQQDQCTPLLQCDVDVWQAAANYQGWYAAAAKTASQKQPNALHSRVQVQQDMSITSPPVNAAAKPGGLTPAKGASDRSPSVDVHEFVDAMLQLSRAV